VPSLSPGTPPAAEAVRRHLIVAGRVQGVWFRESCRREAVALGVSGWARNLSDGTVEVVLEGPRPAVERVIAWCRAGPERARVDRVDVEVGEAVGERAFRVR
jgi:acylphosphatase